MAGQPRKRALIAALERRTRASFEDETSSHMDYVVEWTESGETLVKLMQEISKEAALGELTVGQLMRYLNTWSDRDSRLAKARNVGAHAKVEGAQRLIDDASDEATREQLAKVKMQSDVRLWHAERANKTELGRGADVQVIVNNNTLHLDAMRQRVFDRAAIRVIEEHAPALEYLAAGSYAEAGEETSREAEAHARARSDECVDVTQDIDSVIGSGGVEAK